MSEDRILITWERDKSPKQRFGLTCPDGGECAWRVYLRLVEVLPALVEEESRETFPDLAERRKAAGLTPGQLATRVGIGIKQLAWVESHPTERLEPVLLNRLRVALGIVQDSTLDTARS